MPHECRRHSRMERLKPTAITFHGIPLLQMAMTSHMPTSGITPAVAVNRPTGNGLSVGKWSGFGKTRRPGWTSIRNGRCSHSSKFCRAGGTRIAVFENLSTFPMGRSQPARICAPIAATGQRHLFEIRAHFSDKHRVDCLAVSPGVTRNCAINRPFPPFTLLCHSMNLISYSRVSVP